MSTVAPDTSIRAFTISSEGVNAILSATPLAPYADTLLSLARQYQIDPNWALSYIRWENDFGRANTFSLEHNNIWDILCVRGTPGICGNPQNWGASDCRDPGNGYCYAVYPTMEIGLEAGFRLWNYYVEQGWDTWEKSLAVALCGNLGCVSDPWVLNVIATGQDNAERWPVTTTPPPLPVPDRSFLTLLGGAMILSSGLLVYNLMKGGQL